MTLEPNCAGWMRCPSQRAAGGSVVGIVPRYLASGIAELPGSHRSLELSLRAGNLCTTTHRAYG